jgi:thiamine-phosphate pyrophosphorylase
VPAPTFKLLAISPGGDAANEAWLRCLADARFGEIGAVQIREKHLDDRNLLDLALSARAALLPPAVVLVNGRVDIALAAGADGAHLPGNGVPIAPLRRRFGPGRFGSRIILGRSTHSVEEVERAFHDGADYVTFGPVYATPSKERYGPPVGIEELARASAVGIPVYALGGVTLARFEELAGAGAAGAAAIRLFQGTDPAEIAHIVDTARAFPK